MSNPVSNTTVMPQAVGSQKALLMPQEAAERLIPKFKRMARNLRPHDPLIRQDLVQEMCLGCLTIRVPMSANSFCAHALRRALNFLDKEAQLANVRRSYTDMVRKK